jgi:hypothetical protein
MANETTKTTMTNAIISYLEQQTVESAAQKKVFRPVLKSPRSVIDFTGKGKDVSLLQSNAITFAALTEWDGTGNTNTVALTPTKRTLTPVLIGSSLELSWESYIPSEIDALAMIVNEAAVSYAQAEDSAANVSWAACYTEAHSNNEIGGAYAMTADLVRQGVQKLMTGKARPPFNLFIDPIQWGHLMADTMAVNLMKEFGTQPAGYSAVEGLRMDQFVGKLFGCNIWCVPGGMITSTTLKAMMVGQDALGIAYKNISTPLSTAPSELNMDVQWHPKGRYYDVDLTCCFDVGGIVGASATTNYWVAELATSTT